MEKECSIGGFLFIESPGNQLSEVLEGGHRGVAGSEPMLDVGDRKVIIQGGEEETLKDFYGWAKEGYGSVGDGVF